MPPFSNLCEKSTLPELLWIALSFAMYSVVFAYVGFQASKSGYMGSRGSGSHIRFPENLMSMIYIWTIHICFSVLAAFLAYIVAGGWSAVTSTVLSFYLVIEIVHTVWMITFFRFGAYAKALCIKIFSIGAQVYMMVLYGVIYTGLSFVYFVPVGISCYETIVNIIILVHSCRRYSRVTTSSEPSEAVLKRKRQELIEAMKNRAEDDVQEVRIELTEDDEK